jgi:hypothetical protein
MNPELTNSKSGVMERLSDLNVAAMFFISDLSRWVEYGGSVMGYKTQCLSVTGIVQGFRLRVRCHSSFIVCEPSKF